MLGATPKVDHSNQRGCRERYGVGVAQAGERQQHRKGNSEGGGGDGGRGRHSVGMAEGEGGAGDLRAAYRWYR